MATFNEIIQSDEPVLVDFSADWCAPCRMMAPILQEVKNLMGDSVKVLKVDVDRNPQAAQQYQVHGIPTLILFQRGEIRWRQSGVVGSHQLQAVVRQFTEATN